MGCLHQYPSTVSCQSHEKKPVEVQAGVLVFNLKNWDGFWPLQCMVGLLQRVWLCLWLVGSCGFVLQLGEEPLLSHIDRSQLVRVPQERLSLEDFWLYLTERLSGGIPKTLQGVVSIIWPWNNSVSLRGSWEVLGRRMSKKPCSACCHANWLHYTNFKLHIQWGYCEKKKYRIWVFQVKYAAVWESVSFHKKIV